MIVIYSSVSACVRACVFPGEWECVCGCACSLAYLAYKAYAPCCDVICGPFGSTIFFDTIA